MRGATLFSGIGAPEIAAPDIDWVWHAEIEAFPSAVLAHHHGTPNLGDVTADDFIERAQQYGPIDVLVAGSPCQSFSVAGKRLGLDDPRGNLALVTLRICQQLQPRWLVFENVPGLLSSGGGDDFAAFLDQMEVCGYSGAWRILDAQYAGVAQRRRRVFVVGHLGDDWRPPAAVLFEPAGMCGDTPPSREARKETAPYSGGGIDQGRVVGTVTSKWAKGTGGPAGDEAYNLVCFPAEMSRQTPSVGNLASTLTVKTKLAFAQNSRDEVRLQGGDGQITGALAANSGSKQTTYVAGSHWDDASNPHPTLTQSTRSSGGIGASNQEIFSQRGGGLAYTIHGTDKTARVASETDLAGTIRTRAPGSIENSSTTVALEPNLTVRRLTPRECERLQGFPDDFTLIPFRHGKPAADGPRYKALGNSMAVPVIGWVLDRVRLFTELRP